MAMIVTNNFAAQAALGELNKNNSQVGKLLEKISSGEKVPTAKENAAAYAISERMREKLRTLTQDTQNVQNGSALLRVPSGGVDNIVDELRSLKELAVNAANDTNTDDDRAIIQKEIDQRLQDINDIASHTNFNGKYLLDGSNGYKRVMAQIGSITETHTESVITDYNTNDIQVGPPSYTIVHNSDGTTSYIQDNKYDLTSNFSALSDGTIRTFKPTAGNRMKCDFGFTGSKTWNWESQMQLNYEGVTFSGKAPLTGRSEMAISMDFNLDGVEKISDLDSEGFSILCGGCSQYINIKFDYTKNNSESTYKTATSNSSSNMEYVIGIKDLETLDSNALSEAIFNGVRSAHSNATGEPYVTSDTNIVTIDEEGNSVNTAVSTYLDYRHDLRVALNPNYDENKPANGSKYIFLKLSSPAIDFISKGTVLTTGPNTGSKTGSTTIQVEYPTTVTLSTPIYQDKEVTETIPIYGELKTGTPLYIHHGTNANQATAVLLKDMHTTSLKGTIPSDADKGRLNSLNTTSHEYYEFQRTLIKAADLTLDDISVRTRDDAGVAIKVIEGALEYALDISTNLGAYQQRMDHSSTNIVTMSENVQAAESTIRDSDMAREMTEYTKYNVLMQSSQSMLAQANQNGSNVLGLLR